MKLLSATIHGLFGDRQPVVCSFRDDITILTGRNGAGKTTILKLLWYIISGNVHNALTEINFQSLILETDLYKIELMKVSNNTCRGKFKASNEEFEREFEDERDDDGDIESDARDTLNSLVLQFGASVFFPTFRRIEGGFGLQAAKNGNNFNAMQFRIQTQGRFKNDIELGLQNLATSLSHKAHSFVSSISTLDIVKLLLENYSNLSQQISLNQQTAYQEIIDRIARRQTDLGASEIDAQALLTEISERIEAIQASSKNDMRPWTALSELVERIFISQSIQIGSRVSLGEAANAINSDSLSAGEKQMLSFVSYNAFLTSNIFFIDEPELSLHVDWQRQLFPILLGQATNNQYIICTHSPFIYSKYPESEIILNSDRGHTDLSEA